MMSRAATFAASLLLCASAVVAGPGGLGGPIGPTGPIVPSGPTESDGNQVCSVGNNGLFNIGNLSVVTVKSDDMIGFLQDNPGDQFGSCTVTEEYVCGDSFAAPDWKPFSPLPDPSAGLLLLSLQANAGGNNCIVGSFKRRHFPDGTTEDVMPVTFSQPFRVGPDIQTNCDRAAVNLCSTLNNSGL